jgi:hypothetical protein
MIKILSPETIFSFKNKINKTNTELDQLFESINSSFISSTNKNDKYKNIKFTNHFKKSTNKWKKSLEENDSIKLLVKNNINKLSKDNFDKVSDDLIFALEILDYESLILLANEIFNIILMHPIYMDFYIKLITKMYYITLDKWAFESNNIINILVNMTQIKYYNDYKNLDRVEELMDITLLDNMKFIELEGLVPKELQIVEKSMKISNIKFIVKLYEQKFLDAKIFESILHEMIDFKTTNSMEALIEILNICENNNPEILKNMNQLLKLKDSSKFDFRLTFIYGESLLKYSKNYKVKKESKKGSKPKKSKIDSFTIGCQNILDEYIMIGELEEINEYLKDSVNNYSDLCKFSDVLIKTILCCKETDYIKLKGLIKTLTSKKILKLANVKKGFTNNLKQFNDIAIDYPKATQNLNKLITYSTKSNIIKQDFIDDLIKKYNIEII